LTASGYRLELNGGSTGTTDAAIDFSTMPGGKYTVETGPGHDFDFDYTSKLQRVAIDNAVLKIEDYVYVSGGLSFTRQQGMTVTLNGSGTPETRVVDAFSFGAGDVNLFAGSSPGGDFFYDSNNDGKIDDGDVTRAGATGLALENVNFG